MYCNTIELYCDKRHGLYCNTVAVPTTQPSWALDRVLGARLGVQAGAGRGRWGARQRAAGARARHRRAGGTWQARGSRLERAGLAGGSSPWARGERACVVGGAQARGASATDKRGARVARGLGARPVRTGWASWVLVHPAWFST